MQVITTGGEQQGEGRMEERRGGRGRGGSGGGGGGGGGRVLGLMDSEVLTG